MKNMHRFIRLGVTGTLIIILLIIPIMGVLTITTPPRISVDTKKFSVTPYYAPTTILPQNQTEIWINRTVKISEFLFIKIVDEINITNTKDRPFSAIIIYYPVKFWEKIRQIRILGAYRNDSFKLLNFMIYYRSAEYVGLLIKFYTLLDKYVSILKNTFRIKILFELREGLFEIKPFKDRMGLYLNMTPCPFLPYPIKSLVVNFISPEDVNLEFEFVKPESGKTLFGGRNFKYSKENLPPMDLSLDLDSQLERYGFDSEIKAVWSTEQGLPIVRYAERSIVITKSYTVLVEDHLVVSLYSFEEPAENPEQSRWKLSSIRVGLAANISDVIEVRDDIGKLDFDKTVDEDLPRDIYTVRVNFKSPIIAGENRNVYIKYVIRFNKKFIRNGKFNITLPLLPLVNTTIYTAKLSVKTYVPTNAILPMNCEAKYYERGQEKFFIVQFSQAVFAYNNISPRDIGWLVLVFEYDLGTLLSSYFVLLLYIVILTILVAEVLLVARWAMYRYVKPKEVKRLANLEKFIINYETIIASDKDLWVTAYRNLILRRPTAAFIDDFTKRQSKLNEKVNIVVASIRRLREIAEIYDYLTELGKVEERIRLFKQRIIEVAGHYIRGNLTDEVYEARIEALLLNLKDELNKRERILNTIRDFYISRIS